MLVPKAVGPNAAARKYDILSALSAHALSRDKHRQRQILRLISLITTRYNWQRNELSMGQAEIARLWSVDQRTVKREMTRFREIGWLRVKRAGARGRVTVHELDLGRIVMDTQESWHSIGPDFVARMSPDEPAPEPSSVVPFQRQPSGGAPEPDGSLWGHVRCRLHASDPATWSAWFAGLDDMGRTGDVQCLQAPSQFHATYVTNHYAERLTAVLRSFDPTITGVRVTGK